MPTSARTIPFIVSFWRLHRAPHAYANAMLALMMLTASVASAAGVERPRCRIGLVLSGGGALGIAHVGVLEVLEELQRLAFTVKAGGALRGNLPIYDLYQLGGFLNLSGYRTWQLIGERFVFVRAVYYHRLGSLGALAPGLFAGLSFEAGNMYEPVFTSGSDNGNGVRTSVAAFVGADTALGPIYLGYGRARDGNSAFYLLLGRP